MITSASNERIKQLSALIRRPKERRATGLFTAEGIKIFSEAPRERIEHVFVSESFFQENEAILQEADCTVVRDEIFAKTCDTQTPQGILTVFRQGKHTLEEIIQNAGKGPVILLEDVQDPGNVGTIIRTSEGAGASGVILTSGCADIYSPKTIRSTMGSIFRVPTVFTEDPYKTLTQLKNSGIMTYAAHLRGESDYDEQTYDGRCAILIGNEARGLSDRLCAAADVLVKIPMEGELESLNAAVAAGVLMYTVYSKRRRVQNAKG